MRTRVYYPTTENPSKTRLGISTEKGVLSKSQLLQVARQPSEAKMRNLVRLFALGMMNREQAREEALAESLGALEATA